MIKLKWHGELPDTDLVKLNVAVGRDIVRSLESLDNPCDLMFHTVFLSSDMEGPHVIVWGEPNDNKHFHCQYYHQSNWVSLNEVEDDA